MIYILHHSKLFIKLLDYILQLEYQQYINLHHTIIFTFITWFKQIVIMAFDTTMFLLWSLILLCLHHGL